MKLGCSQILEHKISVLPFSLARLNKLLDLIRGLLNLIKIGLKIFILSLQKVVLVDHGSLSLCLESNLLLSLLQFYFGGPSLCIGFEKEG
jgi:hypothetical protein